MYRFPVGILALTALIACNGGDPDDSDTDSDCENSVVSAFPSNGETSAYYRTTVEVEFDDAEDDATFVVSSSAGDVAGTYAWEDEKLIFTPTNPLAPSTDYTTTVSYSCSSDLVASEWRTSEVGTAVPGDLTGRSYLLDLSSGRFVEPEGVGDIIGEYLDQIVLIGVHAQAGTTIDMIGALGTQDTAAPIEGAHTADNAVKGINQAACEQSIAFPPGISFAANPYFSAGPADTTLSVAGFTVTIEDLKISGAFSPDASYISGATLGGKIDTRPLVPLLSADPAPCDEPTYDHDGSAGTAEVANPNYPCDPGTICTLAASLFVTCEPCADGSTATTCGTGAGQDACCLSLLVDSIEAVELLEEDNSSWPLTKLSELGSGDADDPCTVNPGECASDPACPAT